MSLLHPNSLHYISPGCPLLLHLSLQLSFHPRPAETWHRSSSRVGNLGYFRPPLFPGGCWFPGGRRGQLGGWHSRRSPNGSGIPRRLHGASGRAGAGRVPLPTSSRTQSGGFIGNLLSGTALARCLCTRRSRPRYAERCRCRTPTALCTPAG